MYPRDVCIYKLGSPNYNIKSLWLEQDGDVQFFKIKQVFFLYLYKMIKNVHQVCIWILLFFSPILKGAIKEYLYLNCTILITHCTCNLANFIVNKKN